MVDVNVDVFVTLSIQTPCPMGFSSPTELDTSYYSRGWKVQVRGSRTKLRWDCLIMMVGQKTFWPNILLKPISKLANLWLSTKISNDILQMQHDYLQDTLKQQLHTTLSTFEHSWLRQNLSLQGHYSPLDLISNSRQSTAFKPGAPMKISCPQCRVITATLTTSPSPGKKVHTPP